ncbi:hypothetical protein jhhlp_004035 [Lomentospora prolificans]|uniref:Dienelactone hydrolase domain-containing protein n=1 Tax=Lomentospora prolificans TaxID=41688 RepID=A0A2N3NAG1_9PEZI|nr:hypothetical protein jhhlp_004035 [Lomentospora prolificans]
MSSFPPASHPSAACCSIPPIVSKGYQEKGSYEELGGYKTYATGPSDADKAIVVIYDIFGYFPQTLQGADILATSDKQKYRVFIPDWFKGTPADIAWYPPENDEQKEKLGAWFSKNGFNETVPKVPGYLDALKQKYPNIKSWGILGFCWGGKVTTLVTSSSNNPFQAAATAHPAFLDPTDAPKINVPICVLPSKDENADDVQKFSDGLKVDKYIETFADQIHGWMAARSDLEDKRVAEEYRRGYETVLKFFGKHL